MNQQTWSAARQQKFDFCPRAFYFHYQASNADLSDTVQQDIYLSKGANSPSLQSFKSACLQQKFYDRSLNFRNLIFREGIKRDLEQEVISEVQDELMPFEESPFYFETSPAIVNLKQTEIVESIALGDNTVQGVIHFMWMDNKGKVCLVNYQSTKSSFAVLYALKKYGTSPEKLNTGTLDKNFSITWHSIDWDAVQDIQEKTISFPHSEELDHFQPTPNSGNCNICTFKDVCIDHEAELALYQSY